MFDKLVDFVVQFIKIFQFCTVIYAYQTGVRLRFGKFQHEISPGLRFYFPFGIDRIVTENSVIETMRVKPQSLTTSDGVELTISSVVTFRIADIRTFLLDVEGRNHIIEDSTYGTTAEFVMKHTWEELTAYDDIGNELSKAVRRKAKIYGAEIIAVQLMDFSRCWTLRLINTQPMII